MIRPRKKNPGASGICTRPMRRSIESALGLVGPVSVHFPQIRIIPANLGHFPQMKDISHKSRTFPKNLGHLKKNWDISHKSRTFNTNSGHFLQTDISDESGHVPQIQDIFHKSRT